MHQTKLVGPAMFGRPLPFLDRGQSCPYQSTCGVAGEIQAFKQKLIDLEPKPYSR
ncbi:MAG: hypothetical protein AW11_02378 [Candidatus Accumulibacter regalis]|jgi:hypothetical protein|uniref:Uncharacterized protein n=1 Tax=Accumulibacter regalis TaxID=522306 RepID=A0A011QEL1_ACCRE|nr:hypothetical protein [Accumulibacter sp.]EXI87782.1 MAG: hypothetical protein AW11_02378 [Candidatus Accumulibacter regalis]HRE72892.1 hypothetical protein [Accumulibacter sp.]